MKVFKKILWFFGYPFVGLRFLISSSSIKRLAKKYAKDPESVPEEKRITKVYKFSKVYLYIKQIDIKKLGKEKMDDKPLLYVVNHKSNLDGIVLFKLIYEFSNTPRPIFIAKSELSISKVAPVLDLIDVIYIDRENLRQIYDVINQEIETLKQKDSIVVFPEGTRNETDEFTEFKAAALTPAYETFTSIQPTVIFNSKDLLKQKAISLKNDRTVYVNFLKTISPIDFINVNKDFFMKKLQSKMYDEYLKMKKEFSEDVSKSK